MSVRELIVGTYRVALMEYYAEDGEVGRPYGDAPLGFAFYSAEGYTSTILSRADRPDFVGGDIMSGTDAEKLAAFATAGAFSGRWELVDDTILHHLECTTFPNWVGTTQVRPFEVDERSLTLYPPKMLMNGKIRSAKVRLDRITEQWS
jgi:hypothetical protein